MATLWDCLSAENKERLANLYQTLTGRAFKPPEKGLRVVSWETRIESEEEMVRIMQEVPNYPISGQGRHG